LLSPAIHSVLPLAVRRVLQLLFNQPVVQIKITGLLALVCVH